MIHLPHQLLLSRFFLWKHNILVHNTHHHTYNHTIPWVLEQVHFPAAPYHPNFQRCLWSPGSTLHNNSHLVPICTQSHCPISPPPQYSLLQAPRFPSLGAAPAWPHLHLVNSPRGPCIELLCCPFPCDKGSGYRVIDWFSCRQMGPSRAPIEIPGCMG